jgi:hypothetical protein
VVTYNAVALTSEPNLGLRPKDVTLDASEIIKGLG